LETLYSPWRMAYISSAEKPPECIFCEFPKKNEDEAFLILHRGKTCFVILNAFPYNPGHLMVVPYRHIADYESLSDMELLEMHRLAGACIAVLKENMAPHGFNMGINLGRIAGAGVDGHVHLHVVPRWSGDTNFTTVIGETRVLPEALSVTWTKLKKALSVRV
jgi:Diadenosine tetraphosphate (Ap4A) hydrolase and other HIT family hydrolases